MNERPIILSAPMIRSVLDGRKTLERRIVKPYPKPGIEEFLPADPSGFWGFIGNDPTECIHCPHGEDGDRLWVRETWSHDAESLEQCRSAHEDVMGGSFGPYYKATEVAPDTLRWRPANQMPRWASRLTLEITGVRVDRVQNISGKEAFAEGSAFTTKHPRDWTVDDLAKFEYAELFETINGAGSWAANQWVWIIEFKRV